MGGKSAIFQNSALSAFVRRHRKTKIGSHKEKMLYLAKSSLSQSKRVCKVKARSVRRIVVSADSLKIFKKQIQITPFLLRATKVVSLAGAQ